MTAQAREIEIVGGGLAGLSLGIGLRRENIPVTLYETGDYPRHKVCGEFIADLTDDTLQALDIAEPLADARRNSTLTWFRHDRAFRSDTLPRPALGISRRLLDWRLAERFVEKGGRLQTRARQPASARTRPGLVWAAGRQGKRSDWIGLKAHFTDLELGADLELHLGENAYVGASAIENGRVNVCGLFQIRPLAESDRDRANILQHYAQASGLASFSKRLRSAKLDRASASSVASLSFGVATDHTPTGIELGDAYALIPPFTGDGMAMAFEGAFESLEPIVQFARGTLSWDQARSTVRRRLRLRFRRRLATARAMHPFLYQPRYQALFQAASSCSLIPFGPVFHLLRS